jgi:hypothetical protein
LGLVVVAEYWRIARTDVGNDAKDNLPVLARVRRHESVYE